MKRGRIVSIGLALAASAAAPPSTAATTASTLPVSLTIESSCAIDAGALAFGTLGPDTPIRDTQTALALSCTPGTAFSVAMDEGRNGSRRMADNTGGAFVPYEIYQDSAGTRRWGGTSSAAISGIVPANGQLVLTAYARITGAAPGPSSYSDIVTVMVSF